MPWIESHTELKDHPKVSMLADSMGWSIFETIGRLHCFWYWCLAYAPTGDLRKFNDAQIGSAVVLNGDDAQRFVKAMVAARWLDRGDGVFRVHDWLDYAGRYLRDTKFKRSADKWAEAEHLYLKEVCQPTVSRQSADCPPHQPTNRTNQPTDPPTPRAGECNRLHGIPANVEEVIEYGKLCNPIISEARCRAFWSHYEGQARTSPNGDVFWVTSGEAVVTNWRVKLPEFGNGKDGAAQRVGAAAGAFPPSITQQIASTKSRIEEVQRELNKIGCPNRDVFPAEYEVATKKRAPLLEEKSKLQGRLRELHQTVAAT